MKAIITVLLLPTLLCGCRLYTVTQGEGVVYTDNSNFLCVNNSGDCVQHYDSPTTETLQALPSPDYAFTRWEGCHYDSLTSCEAEISQRAVDEDMEWTITAVFEKKRPDIEPAQYTYNALGQRITKTVGGVTTVFQYDLDGKLIAELDANGHPLRQHAYLDGSPIAMIERKTAESDPEVYYVHTDHLATPDLITNDQGRIVADFEKSPFGVPYVNYSEIEYHLGFPGQYYDAESGLHYNYYRNYDANTGRYVQSDPIGLAGGLNTYGYVYQNPLSYKDPYGEIGLLGGTIGFVSAFGGTLATGGSFGDAVINGSIGALAGAIPGAGTFIGAILKGGGIGALGNAIGQGIQIARSDCKTISDFNTGSLIGAAIGGALTGGRSHPYGNSTAAQLALAPTNAGIAAAAGGIGTAVGAP
jgi:RHS repeat-associated protein